MPHYDLNSKLDFTNAENGLIFRAYEWIMGYSAFGFKLHNGARMVRCPSLTHPPKGLDGSRDRHPSCKLEPAKNVFYCFACGANGGIKDMIIVAGAHKAISDAKNDNDAAVLWLKDRLQKPRPAVLIPQPPMKHHRDATVFLENERITGEYPYVNQYGTVLFKVVRFDGTGTNGMRDKRFEAWQPTDRERWCRICKKRCGWRHDTRGVRIVPYRLPEVTEAARNHRVIFVVEGEKKADALAEYGFTATSAPFGSAFAFPTRWKPYFAGADILVVIPDCDAVGRAAAAARAHVLEGAAKRTIVMDLWPEKNDGYDIYDYVYSLQLLSRSAEYIAWDLRSLFTPYLRPVKAAPTPSELLTATEIPSIEQRESA
jgi:hypothetical protein